MGAVAVIFLIVLAVLVIASIYAMGAFNDWTRGTFLERPENRGVVTVAMNLLYGAAKLLRSRWLCAQGIEVPSAVSDFRPQSVEELLALDS